MFGYPQMTEVSDQNFVLRLDDQKGLFILHASTSSQPQSDASTGMRACRGKKDCPRWTTRNSLILDGQV